MDQPIAYYGYISGKRFYTHAACIDEAARRNVNNLSPEQLASDRRGFFEIPLAMVPEMARCDYPPCMRLIHDKSAFEQ